MVLIINSLKKLFTMLFIYQAYIAIFVLFFLMFAVNQKFSKK